MPDWTMCGSSCCPDRKHCYRYRAIPKEIGQSYGDFYEEYKLRCDMFLEIMITDRLSNT